MNTNNDLLDDFSQARAQAPTAPTWQVLQWHGGNPAAAGSGAVRDDGGFFLDEERLEALGLDPSKPVPGFEPTSLRFSGKAQPVPGWGAATINVSVLYWQFNWEDRESLPGMRPQEYPHDEYDRRKREAPGTEREIRGRLRMLVAVRELMPYVNEPLLLTFRGEASRSAQNIIAELKRMSAEATKIRKKSGGEGVIPTEAFWITITRGPIQQVGKGQQSSQMSLPATDVPKELDRDYLVGRLVEREHRIPGGTWDQWAEVHGPVWEERVVQLVYGQGGTPPAEGPDALDPAVQQARDVVMVFIAEAAVNVLTPDGRAPASVMDRLSKQMQEMGFANPKAFLPELAEKFLGRTLTVKEPMTESEAVGLTNFLRSEHGEQAVNAIWPIG